jgi:hypothetical protein
MNKLLDNLSKNNIVSFNFISILLGFLFYASYFCWDENYLLIIIFALFELINLARLWYSELLLKIVNKLIDYRYIVGIIAFVFCLVFGLHGSSIGVYNDTILENSHSSEKSEILGSYRMIRSDEWMVHTPYYFSQFYNDYRLESNQMSISGQDMTISYNAPVKNITELAKPQSWGYILFGNEVGLSWYWCIQLILLCLGSFEFAMILTKKNRLLSFLGMMLIAFSPLLHWWFVPHVTIVFLWGIISTVLGYYFFTTKSEKKRVLASITLVISICAFVFAIFPSCQIPVGLISIVLLIMLLIRDKEKITFKRINIINLFVMALFVLGILGYFVYTSWDAINLILNTVYPGERISTGKDALFTDLFTDLTVLFLPYKDITYLNNSEVSDFIHLGPLFLILFPFMRGKIDKKDLLIGKAMFIMLLIQIVFMLFGFPEIIARITFFSEINRMYISYGYLATLFTIWGIYVISQNRSVLKGKWIILISISYGLVYLTLLSAERLSYQPVYVYLIEILIYVCLVYLILSKRVKVAVIILAAMIMMASFTINPLVAGTSAITNHKVYEEVKDIVEKDDSNWVVLNDSGMSSYLLFTGAKVVNAVNYYPDYGKWEAIDPEFEHNQIYNRYAHINLTISNEKSYEILAPDSISVDVDYEVLKKWDVKYVFSGKNIEEYLQGTNYELLYEDMINMHYIYELKE